MLTDAMAAKIKCVSEELISPPSPAPPIHSQAIDDCEILHQTNSKSRVFAAAGTKAIRSVPFTMQPQRLPPQHTPSTWHPKLRNAPTKASQRVVARGRHLIFFEFSDK